jgi:formylmethanofuran dehydrogenase subunit E
MDQGCEASGDDSDGITHIMNDDREVLQRALEFHGHRCWASVAGVRAGLAALRELGVKRSGGRQLHAFIEIGEDHGGMCFGDGVQYATGCTLGKGNMEKTPYGKLAVTLIERASNRALRVSYKPTLQKRIGESAFMVKRGQGIEPDDIPEAEQLELVDLMWNAPESDVLTIDKAFQFDRDWMPEIMGFVPCAACHELTARAYLRVVGDKHVCIPCSGYER